jgi:hypothetical protein
MYAPQNFVKRILATCSFVCYFSGGDMGGEHSCFDAEAPFFEQENVIESAAYFDSYRSF